MSQPLPNKQEDEDEDEQKPAPGAEENIVVRTKFPVARLKRIVQADEDVGKVAQSTPVAVCKQAFPFLSPPCAIPDPSTSRPASTLFNDFAKFFPLIVL